MKGGEVGGNGAGGEGGGGESPQDLFQSFLSETCTPTV